MVGEPLPLLIFLEVVCKLLRYRLFLNSYMTHPLIILSKRQQAAKECLHHDSNAFFLHHTDTHGLEDTRSS